MNNGRIPDSLYILGWFDPYHNNEFHSAHGDCSESVFTNYNDAMDVLTSVTIGMQGRGYKLYRIDCCNAVEISADKMLKDFISVRNNVWKIIENMVVCNWKDTMPNHFFSCCSYFCGVEFRLSRTRNTITVVIRKENFSFGGYTSERTMQEQKDAYCRYEKELGDFARYCLKPILQKYVDDNNIETRVEIKYSDGTKAVKGFITKGAKK